MREKIISLNEKRFASQCVAEGQRLDGRKLTEARSVSVKLGPSWGFAEVHFDDTHAIASTTVDAMTPATDRPNEGTLSISIELSPASSESSARESLQRSSGHHPFLETRTAIESFVRDSRTIDTEALCILAGVKVWAVRVTVDIINDDGNCTDVAMMAVLASLLHARRPDVSVSGREVRVYSMDEREPLPLPVHHIPLAASFATFGAGKPYEDDIAVLDPTKLEEHASSGKMSFAFNAQGEVCGVYKAGGLPLRPSTFAECATLGAARITSLTEVLKNAMMEAAAEHPLAGTRPMLVNPEPTAVIRTQIIEMDDEVDEGVDNLPTSMWNATPITDEAPPSVMKPNKNEADLVDEGVEQAFSKKKAMSRQVDFNDKAETDKVNINLDSEEEGSEDSEQESSDEDLEDAILPKQKGRRR